MKKCPYCAEEIQDEAIKCKHCMEMLDAPPRRTHALPWYFRTYTLVVIFLCCGPLVVPLIWLRPGLSQKQRILITLLALLLSMLVIQLMSWSIRQITDYYSLLNSLLSY